MALNQIIQHQTGAYSSYWRVTVTNLDYQSNTATLVMLGYVDAASRQSDKLNLDRREFVVTGADFVDYFSVTELNETTNPIKQSYLYIKTTNEFIGSLDV